jgi:hypothetical protein
VTVEAAERSMVNHGRRAAAMAYIGVASIILSYIKYLIDFLQLTLELSGTICSCESEGWEQGQS